MFDPKDEGQTGAGHETPVATPEETARVGRMLDRLVLDRTAKGEAGREARVAGDAPTAAEGPVTMPAPAEGANPTPGEDEVLALLAEEIAAECEGLPRLTTADALPSASADEPSTGEPEARRVPGEPHPGHIVQWRFRAHSGHASLSPDTAAKRAGIAGREAAAADADDAATPCPNGNADDAVPAAAPSFALRKTPNETASMQVAPEPQPVAMPQAPPMPEAREALAPIQVHEGAQGREDTDDPEDAPKGRSAPATARKITESRTAPPMAPTIENDPGPIEARSTGTPRPPGPPTPAGGRGGGGGGNARFHRRLGPQDFRASYGRAVAAVRGNLVVVMAFTVVINVLVLAIPLYLFQISDRVLTSRSTDTLVMLTVVVVGAVVVQAFLDKQRRHIMMRTAVEVEVQLGAPILSAAARSSLNGTSRDYQVLGDLQSLRSFLTSGTLISFLDAPLAPLFVAAVFLVHPQLGFIVIGSGVALLIVALVNQKVTAIPFREANQALTRANVHLDSMSRNSQIINALAMIPEAVQIWGRDTAQSLRRQVVAQDRNVTFATISRASRMLTQVAMLGWGAHLAILGEITGGMVIAASIIASRALAPIEGTIEGWNQFAQTRVALGRIRTLLHQSVLNLERLRQPNPRGQLNVENLLYVPKGTKSVILNSISFRLQPGETLGVIGNSGAGKTTLGKMLVGSIIPTSGAVRLDLMDLRNWDQRQLGESIGYLPQDVQLFPGSIKQNIARMRTDATDEAIYAAAELADVHELIASLPMGYETVVGADGAPLSGGQKQRIALARAFYGNPRFVVLDEPNSNLDTNGEKALAKALEHARREKITVVAITQRHTLLDCVDKILVLKDGHRAAFGDRERIKDALKGKDRGPASDGGGTIEGPMGDRGGTA